MLNYQRVILYIDIAFDVDIDDIDDIDTDIDSRYYHWYWNWHNIGDIRNTLWVWDGYFHPDLEIHATQKTSVMLWKSACSIGKSS